MAKVFDLYGVRGMDLAHATQRLDALLGIPFALHSSDYRGGDYNRATYLGAELSLQPNVLPFLKTLAEPEYPEFDLLLHVGPIEDPDALRTLLEQDGDGRFIWLRRTTLENGKQEVVRRDAKMSDGDPTSR